MIPLILILGVGYLLYDTLANTYVVRDKRTGKRVGGPYYVPASRRYKRRKRR